jgi:sugar-specific transcriptional regulator TrmB
MATDYDFIFRLIGFGLSEKEALLYLQLLKYGPKTPTPLAKSLHTYREDVYRTLNSLIEKGMVKPSLDAPTVYAAVDLETALESALTKRESELREMELLKQQLKELARQQQVEAAADGVNIKILKSIKEVVTVAKPLIDSLQEELLLAVPVPAATIATRLGINGAASEFVTRGGKVRILTDISYSNVDSMRELMESGGEVRHFNQHEMPFVVFDRKIAMSGIDIEIAHFSLSQPIAALWTDDPAYAQYLAATFEILWNQGINAEDRIQQLLEQGPPQADH